MKLTELNLNRTLFENALPIFLKQPSLSFEDSCLVTYAELNDATPLWTFDKTLANQILSSKLVAL